MPSEKPKSSAVVLTTELGITVKVSAGLAAPHRRGDRARPRGHAGGHTSAADRGHRRVADTQVANSRMSGVEPSAKVPVAMNCPVTPSPSSGLPGETAIDTSRDVRQAERGRAVTPLAVADTV